MPSKHPPTTIRFTDEDRKVLAKLHKMTGLDTSALVRLAIRESLAARSLQGKR
jgi:hypothetical protein